MVFPDVVKIGQAKDGCQKGLFRFHVSWSLTDFLDMLLATYRVE